MGLASAFRMFQLASTAVNRPLSRRYYFPPSARQMSEIAKLLLKNHRDKNEHISFQLEREKATERRLV